MKNPYRIIKDALDPQTALEEGWTYEPDRPALSPERRRKLMEASSLDTPRSSMQAVTSILLPYWTKSSWGERATGAALLATSLLMTWYAVQVTVEFGHWQSGLANTVQQLFQTMMNTRGEMLEGALNNYPALQEMLANNPELHDILQKYPDTTSILYDPAFRDAIASNPELREILGQSPSVEDLFALLPGFQEELAANPDLMNQLGNLRDDLSGNLLSQPAIQDHLRVLGDMSGGSLVTNVKESARALFNSAANNTGNPFDENARQALKNTWQSKDLATIALKFTGMAIISYKSAQYLALRWRSWTTGYFTKKWTSCKAYARLKNQFNNIDNPGQRIQEDPQKFTSGAVSLMTGVTNAGITLASFSGLLWSIPFMGVPGGFFWIGAGYAAGLTALTIGAGYKMPEIQRNQQRREADFRASLDKIHNNADFIALNNSEELERDLVKKRFKPVMTNSVREIGTQVKLIVVDATAGNLSIPIPWVVGAFAVASGTASMGTIQTLNYAFNRVTTSMSFIVNRFNQLSEMKATADRIYMFDQAVDAAHYIEEAKRQAALEVSGTGPATPPPPPSSPGGLKA